MKSCSILALACFTSCGFGERPDVQEASLELDQDHQGPPEGLVQTENSSLIEHYSAGAGQWPGQAFFSDPFGTHATKAAADSASSVASTAHTAASSAAGTAQTAAHTANAASATAGHAMTAANAANTAAAGAVNTANAASATAGHALNAANAANTVAAGAASTANGAAATAGQALTAANSASTVAAGAASTAGLALGLSIVALVVGMVALGVACFAIYKACNPADPWGRIEEKVTEMINGKLDEARRQRLSGRLGRYLHSYGLCTRLFIHSATAAMKAASSTTAAATLANGSSLFEASHISTFQHLEDRLISTFGDYDISKEELFDVSLDHPEVPHCMLTLEATMSLEADEWLNREGDAVDSLFLPFSKMHVQLQEFITKYPPKVAHPPMGNELKRTSAEYAQFLLAGMKDSWQTQICRTMRLRETEYKGQDMHVYNISFLTPVKQAHSGENCWNKCNKVSGWCDFCGGKDVGACCKKDDKTGRDECNQFKGLIPNVGSAVCVYTDCQMYNTKYDRGVLGGKSDSWEDCQQLLQSSASEYKFFTWYPARGGLFKRDAMCYFHKEGAARRYDKGARPISGPRECPEQPEKKVQTEAQKKQVMSIETDEAPACIKESPPVLKSNFEALLQDEASGLAWWLKACWLEAMPEPAADFNSFYLRFQEDLDHFADLAGCPMQEFSNEDSKADDTPKEVDWAWFGNLGHAEKKEWEKGVDVTDTMNRLLRAPTLELTDVFHRKDPRLRKEYSFNKEFGPDPKAWRPMMKVLIVKKGGATRQFEKDTQVDLSPFFGTGTISSEAAADDFTAISQNAAYGGNFGMCDWDIRKKPGVWTPDAEKASGGWFQANSKIVLDLQRSLGPFPSPLWLEKRRRAEECLKKAAAPDDGAEFQKTLGPEIEKFRKEMDQAEQADAAAEQADAAAEQADAAAESADAAASGTS